MNDSKKGAICQTPNVFCVYVIWCSLTDKFYVGVTYQKVAVRIRQHRRGKQFIDREIQQIGWENFDWWVVEKNISAEKIDECEKYWVKFFNSVYPNGYNRTHGGIGRISVTAETCALISKRARERDMSGENNPMYGRHHTDATKAIISAKMSGENGSMYGKPPANKGVPHTPEAKAKMSEAQKGEKNHFYGKHHTEESKEKNRQAHLGKHPSEETLAKMRGRHPSEEARAKMSESRKGEKNHFYGKHHTPETKAILSEKLSGENSPNYGRKHTEESKAKMRAAALARNAAKRAAQTTP